MSLAARLEKDFLQAYKSKEQLRVAVLRMVKTAIKNKQVELGRIPDDQEILELISGEVKKRQEAIDLYQRAARKDLVEKETQEANILQDYLPALLSGEELARIINNAVAATGARGPQDLGRVMQAVMADYKGRVDGKLLSSLVRTRLTA